MPKSNHKNDRNDKNNSKDKEKLNAQDLAERIRQRKLQGEQEAEEEEERRRSLRQQDTEEDDENLQEDDDEGTRDQKRDRKEEKKDDNQKDKDEEDKVSENNGDETESGKDDLDDNFNQEDLKDTKSASEGNPETEAVKKDTAPKTDVNAEPGTSSGTSTGINSGTSAGTDVGTSTGINSGTSVGASTGSATTGVAGTAEASTGAASAGVASTGTAGASVAGANVAGAGVAGTGAGAGMAGAGAASAGAGAAGAGVAVAGASAFAIVLLILLIFIIVAGIRAFFIMMPGMVVGKIGEAINGFRENLSAFFDGTEAAKIFVNREQVVGAAEYLNQMGYDLKGYGFLDEEVKKEMTAEYNDGTWASIKDWWSETDESESSNLPLKNFNTKSIQERKQEDKEKEYQKVYLDAYDSTYSDSDIRKHILLAKDADDEITFAKSKYLAMYLSAENAIYLIRNDNTSFFNRAANLIGLNDTSNGSGLVYFINPRDQSISDYVTNAQNVDFKDVDSWFNLNRANIHRPSRTMIIKNEDDGWFKSSNYTYSLDGWASSYGVPLQLSLALHLSSLAPDFAYEVAERGTTETAVEMGLVELENVTTEPVLFLDLGDGKQYYEVENSGDLYRFIQVDGNPKVLQGTGEDGYFEPGDSTTPSAVVDAFGGKITAGEMGDFFEDLDDLDITTQDFTKFVPIILNVKDHWYRDLSFKGCYQYTGEPETTYMKFTLDSGESDILKSGADAIYVKETAENGTIEQIAEPTQIGEAGSWIKGLIDNNVYYKYDGTRKSEHKSKINFAESAVDAIAMLEQIQGEDSKAMIRMFKELMASYNIYFVESQSTKMKNELFQKVIRNYSGTLFPDGDDCLYKANIPPSQTGFEEDLIVQAPAKGRVTYKTEDSVCIEFTKKGEKFYKYSIFISGFKVNDDINIGQSVKEGTELGKTIRHDLGLILRDENGAIVKNKYVETVGNEDGADVTDVDNADVNKDVRVPKSNPKYTKEELTKIFKKYGKGKAGKNLEKYVNEFYNLQKNYGVDPLFAAAVTINEQSVGTAKSTCSKQNNWFSVRAENGDWDSFSSPKESIDSFGNMIANGTNYFSQGRYTIQQIGKKYCIPPDKWIKKVAKTMKELEGYKK